MTIDQQTENDQVLAGAELDLDRVLAFAGQVAENHAIASNGVLTYLGDRLGLWRTLASVGPVTSAELAERSGLAERYVREWVSAQAAAGYVTYDAATQRFTLPAEHAAVLADDDSPAALVGAFEITAAVWAERRPARPRLHHRRGRRLARARRPPVQRGRAVLPARSTRGPSWTRGSRPSTA